jgi:transposase-like protein
MGKKRGSYKKHFSYEEKCFAVKKYLEEDADVKAIGYLITATPQAIYVWLKKVDYSGKN